MKIINDTLMCYGKIIKFQHNVIKVPHNAIVLKCGVKKVYYDSTRKRMIRLYSNTYEVIENVKLNDNACGVTYTTILFTVSPPDILNTRPHHNPENRIFIHADGDDVYGLAVFGDGNIKIYVRNIPLDNGTLEDYILLAMHNKNRALANQILQKNKKHIKFDYNNYEILMVARLGVKSEYNWMIDLIPKAVYNSVSKEHIEKWVDLSERYYN